MRTRQATILCALAALLAACGSSPAGAPGADGGGATSALSASGTITGVGTKLTVDGVGYDLEGATVTDDTDPAHPAPATVADLHIGQQVHVTFDPAHGTTVGIETTLAGLIDPGSIDTAAGRFTVLGQPVQVSAGDARATLLVGVRGASGLKDGQLVRVHGPVDAAGVVLARLVAVMPEGAPLLQRVSGVARAVDASGHTFRLGSLTVAYADARLLPAGAAVHDGDAVVVVSRRPTTGTAPALALAADVVRVIRAERTGVPFRIAGPVTSVTPVAGRDVPDFTLHGLRVDCARAKLADGTAAAALVVGVVVRVEGTLAGDVLSAAEVAVLSDEAQRVVLVGPVSSFTGPGSFVVRGTTVDASSARFTGAATVAQLADGVVVAIRGHVSGAVVIADEITVLPPPPDVELRLTGVVRHLEAAAGTFELAGLEMALDPQTAWTGGTAADLANGVLVQVTGVRRAEVVRVTTIRILGDPGDQLRPLSGVISGVTADAFVLNDVTVAVTSATEIVNGPLADGQRVLVLARGAAGGALAAVHVEVLPSPHVCDPWSQAKVPGVSVPCGPGAAAASLTGAVSGLTGATMFEVDGQAVDAARASFQPAGRSAKDLAVGQLVAVRGSVSKGVLNADVVVFLQ